MSEIQQQEANLMEVITNRLEEFEYLSQIRAELKVLSMKKAEELVQKGQIRPTENTILKKSFNEEDIFYISLCQELFKYCHLDKTNEMLCFEVSSNLVHIDHEKLQLSKDLPVLVQVIDKE